LTNTDAGTKSATAEKKLSQRWPLLLRCH
jgi:hypothetical protein